MSLCAQLERASNADSAWRREHRQWRMVDGIPRRVPIVRFDSPAEVEQLAILDRYLALPLSKRARRKRTYLERFTQESSA